MVLVPSVQKFLGLSAAQWEVFPRRESKVGHEHQTAQPTAPAKSWSSVQAACLLAASVWKKKQKKKQRNKQNHICWAQETAVTVSEADDCMSEKYTCAYEGFPCSWVLPHASLQSLVWAALSSTGTPVRISFFSFCADTSLKGTYRKWVTLGFLTLCETSLIPFSALRHNRGLERCPTLTPPHNNGATLEMLNNFSVLFTIQNSSSLLPLSPASRAEQIKKPKRRLVQRNSCCFSPMGWFVLHLPPDTKLGGHSAPTGVGLSSGNPTSSQPLFHFHLQARYREP